MAKKDRIINLQTFQRLLDKFSVENSSIKIEEFIEEKLRSHRTLKDGPKKSTITSIMKPGENHSINDHNLMCIAFAFGIPMENRMWLCEPVDETGSTITAITLEATPTVATETPPKPVIPPAPPNPDSTDPKVQKLTAEILNRIDQLDGQVFEQICQMEPFLARGPFNTRLDFVRTLVEDCDVEPALIALIRVANATQRSSQPPSLNSSSRLLAEVRDRLIPLTWGKEFATKMVEQIRANGVNLVERIVQHQAIADVMMSGYDVRPIAIDKTGLGEAAIPTCQVPDSGGGPDAICRSACDFLQHLAKQFSSRFLDNHQISSVNPVPQSDEATLKKLASTLQNFVNEQSEIRERTIYAVVHFPRDHSERIHLQQVIKRICQDVQNLVFVEVLENPDPDNRLEVKIRSRLFSIKVV
jgi:hypothetical protein